MVALGLSHSYVFHRKRQIPIPVVSEILWQSTLTVHEHMPTTQPQQDGMLYSPTWVPSLPSICPCDWEPYQCMRESWWASGK